VLQDDVNHFQDVTTYAQIPRDPWDGSHAKIRQNLRNVPHQNHQAPGLNDAVHLNVLEELLELGDHHQFLAVVSGVES
jgi:hypothetical protein